MEHHANNLQQLSVSVLCFAAQLERNVSLVFLLLVQYNVRLFILRVYSTALTACTWWARLLVKTIIEFNELCSPESYP